MTCFSLFVTPNTQQHTSGLVFTHEWMPRALRQPKNIPANHGIIFRPLSHVELWIQRLNLIFSYRSYYWNTSWTNIWTPQKHYTMHPNTLETQVVLGTDLLWDILLSLLIRRKLQLEARRSGVWVGQSALIFAGFQQAILMPLPGRSSCSFKWFEKKSSLKI